MGLHLIFTAQSHLCSSYYSSDDSKLKSNRLMTKDMPSSVSVIQADLNVSVFCTSSGRSDELAGLAPINL